FVVDKHRLQKCSNYHYRLLIVNWLIYAHKVLELSETTLFAAVRMFDHMLVATQIPDKKYQLVGITCMWIASKLYDHYLILVPKLFSLCSGKFSKYQIISTEKEILKVSSFNVNFPDPSTFLFYFLKEVGLENDPKIRFSAMFVMEMFTFVLEYTSSSPSLLAASALFIALCQNGRDYLPFLKYVHSCLTDVVIFKNYTKLMWFSIKQVLKTTVTSNEIVAKYSVQDKLNVAQLFSPL
ncbi:G2/mitotic-specific cyclin-2-like, partial [Asbolus verrucosus]